MNLSKVTFLTIPLSLGVHFASLAGPMLKGEALTEQSEGVERKESSGVLSFMDLLVGFGILTDAPSVFGSAAQNVPHRLAQQGVRHVSQENLDFLNREGEYEERWMLEECTVKDKEYFRNPGRSPDSPELEEAVVLLGGCKALDKNLFGNSAVVFGFTGSESEEEKGSLMEAGCTAADVEIFRSISLLYPDYMDQSQAKQMIAMLSEGCKARLGILK